MNARELITNVLQDIGKFGVGDYLDDTDADYCLGLLNDWVDALALESLNIFFTVRTVVPLGAATASYTIGTGGVINIVRPMDIHKAAIIANNLAATPTEQEIDVFTDQRWQQTPQKMLLAAVSTGVFFDHGWTSGLGVIHPYPIPNVATTSLVLYTEQAFARFANLDTDYTFPPGYQLFFRTNLAAEIAAGFGKTLTKEQTERAIRARAMVQQKNSKGRRAAADPNLMTARTLIADVLEDLGQIGVGEYLDDADAEYAFRRLNDWIDSLALESLLIYYLLRTQRTLSANVPTYTIGTGGVINIVRPVRIEKAGLIQDINATIPYEQEIAVLTHQRWQQTPQKTFAGPLAQAVWYDKNWASGLGLIYPWPIPNVGTTALVLYTEQAFVRFATLDTAYTFPPGYQLFFRTNLARELASGFKKTLTASQEQQATRARAMVKRANIKVVESELDPRTPGVGDRYGGRPRPFNWRTGE